jgi:hypothetical protein
MIGQTATSAMSTSDGVVISHAKRRSGTPRERRFGVPTCTEAASAMADQNVSNAFCMSDWAFFSASSGEVRPASASLTFS